MRERKVTIWKLADQLSAGDDFQELNGTSVRNGVEQTLIKNLTRANKEKGPKIEILNSLGGIDKREWLPVQRVFPTVPYMDFLDSGGRCEGGHGPGLEVGEIVKNGAVQVPNHGFPPEVIPGGQMPQWKDTLLEGPEGGEWNSAVGFEKNPWYMAYFGVKVTTQPRKPFAPFGRAVTLTARAFAKPFGGRIGPWMRSQWPFESPVSAGNQPVDPLLPDRFDPDSASASTPEVVGRRIPNFAKYPGDTLGLNTILALGVARDGYFANGQRLDHNYYGFLPSETDNLAYIRDPSGAPVPNPIPWIRKFEIAAIVPDIFDVTYYSIDPNFSRTYLDKAAGLFGPAIKFNYDLGGHGAAPNYSVAQQMGEVGSRRNL
jgi:hypothetical protein